jgi:hypothetical protein
MRKLFSLLLISGLLLSASSAFAGTFSDVEDGYDSTIAIEYLVAIGTLEGYSDNTFRPENTINRAELMKVLVAGQGIEPISGEYTSNCFPDVPAGEWYEPYVCYAYDQGWVDGYPDNTFLPGNTVNRAEAAKMITNGMEFGDRDDEDLLYISIVSDVSEDDWFAPYVNVLIQGGIDDSSYTFSPGDGMTREDAASFLFRITAVNETEYTYYNTVTREAFLTQEGMTDILDQDYSSTGDDDEDEEADIGVTLQSYGDLTIKNYGSTMDFTGYYLSDEYGSFYYEFSGTIESGASIDVSADELLNYESGENDLSFYDPSGNWISSWSVY